jgi:hypothetical protein
MEGGLRVDSLECRADVQFLPAAKTAGVALV